MFKIDPRYKKYIRPVAGIIFLMLGSVFMLLPFIPLGYIMIFGGLFLFSAELPFLQKWLNKIRHKDKKGRVDKVEKGIENTEKKMTK